MVFIVFYVGDLVKRIVFIRGCYGGSVVIFHHGNDVVVHVFVRDLCSLVIGFLLKADGVYHLSHGINWPGTMDLPKAIAGSIYGIAFLKRPFVIGRLDADGPIEGVVE